MLSILLSDLGASADIWKILPPDDRTLYLKMRETFHHETECNSAHSRHHCMSFRDQLRKVFEFVDMKLPQRQVRGLLAGVIKLGEYVCVNTRQLQKFTGRCKSSINNGFQQLGYASLKSKSQTQTCLMTALPCLIKDQGLSRQWTVRYLAKEEKKGLPIPIIDAHASPNDLSSPSIEDLIDSPFPNFPIETFGMETEERLRSDPNFMEFSNESVVIGNNAMWW